MEEKNTEEKLDELEKTNEKDLVKTTLNYITDNKLSQSAMAKLIGVSESTLSRWVKGNYPNPETIESKIIEYLEKEKARNESTLSDKIDFVDTSISTKIQHMINYYRIHKSIGCIYGDAGVGKTKTVTEWIKDRQDVIYIAVGVTCNEVKPFLRRLAKEVQSIKTGTSDDIYINILKNLSGSDKTIIIDEAQHLTFKTLEMIRSINDATKTTIVLVGNEKVYTQLLGNKQEEFAQLFSRVLDKLQVFTTEFVISDMEKIFGGQLDAESNRYMLDVARSKHGLRGAIHVFINAKNNGNITKKGLKAAAHSKGIRA